MPAITLPTSRASPSIASPRMCGVDARRRGRPRPPPRAPSAAWRSCASRRARRRGSPGLTVSPPPLSSSARSARPVRRCRSARGSRARRRRWSDRRPSGPEAMSLGSSPGTSEISSVTHPRRMARRGEPSALDRREVAAHAVHLADRRRRLASSARLTRLLVGERQPAAGSDSSDEPPPEIRQSTRSSGRQALHQRAGCAAAASTPAASGTGCAASTISMRSAGHARSRSA